MGGELAQCLLHRRTGRLAERTDDLVHRAGAVKEGKQGRQQPSGRRPLEAHETLPVLEHQLPRPPGDAVPGGEVGKSRYAVDVHRGHARAATS